MTSHRIFLVLAGAAAVAGIGIAMILRHIDSVSAPTLMAMLLGTYVLGLGLGRLALNRRG